MVLPPHLHLPHARVPPMATAAGACWHWPRRHMPRVAWPGVPPLVGGLFRQKFSRVVFSSILLVQVVSCVKNSLSWYCYCNFINTTAYMPTFTWKMRGLGSADRLFIGCMRRGRARHYRRTPSALSVGDQQLWSPICGAMHRRGSAAPCSMARHIRSWAPNCQCGSCATPLTMV
jgi:hypothetical protein